jgi:hypothetical protein
LAVITTRGLTHHLIAVGLTEKALLFTLFLLPEGRMGGSLKGEDGHRE